MSRNVFLSSRFERKHFRWRWYCHKKHKNVNIEIWFIVVCTLIDNEYASLLFSQTFFSYCFCLLSDFAKVFERKVWRVQVAHLHNTARALSTWTLLSPARVQPLYGAGRKESSGTGLHHPMMSSSANYGPFLSSFRHIPPSGAFCQVSKLTIQTEHGRLWEMFIWSKLGQTPLEMHIRTFTRIKNVT